MQASAGDIWRTEAYDMEPMAAAMAAATSRGSTSVGVRVGAGGGETAPGAGPRRRLRAPLPPLPPLAAGGGGGVRGGRRCTRRLLGCEDASSRRLLGCTRRLLVGYEGWRWRCGGRGRTGRGGHHVHDGRGAQDEDSSSTSTGRGGQRTSSAGYEEEACCGRSSSRRTSRVHEALSLLAAAAVWQTWRETWPARQRDSARRFPKGSRLGSFRLATGHPNTCPSSEEGRGRGRGGGARRGAAGGGRRRRAAGARRPFPPRPGGEGKSKREGRLAHLIFWGTASSPRRIPR